jgi:hypothetical protein
MLRFMEGFNMNTQSIISKSWFFLLVFLVGSVSQPIFAAEVTLDGKTLESQMAHLSALRARDQAAFNEKIAEHRAQLKEKLKYLRQTNPNEFNQILAKRKATIQKHLDRMKTESPNQLKQYLKKHREMLNRSAATYQASHPERFRKFEKERAERLQAMKQAHPDRFHSFLTEHSSMKNRLQSSDAQQHALAKSRNEAQRLSQTRVPRFYGQNHVMEFPKSRNVEQGVQFKHDQLTQLASERAMPANYRAQHDAVAAARSANRPKKDKKQ